MTYRHTQTGWLSLASLGVGTLALLGLMVAGVAGRELVVPVLLLAAVGSQVARMTVAVEGDTLVVASGTGHLRKTVDLRQVAQCEVVRNAWWMGWGLRWIPGGWLINVSGLDAIELTYRTGGRLRVGTDEPWQLCDAVQAALEDVR